MGSLLCITWVSLPASAGASSTSFGAGLLAQQGGLLRLVRMTFVHQEASMFEIILSVWAVRLR